MDVSYTGYFILFTKTGLVHQNVPGHHEDLDPVVHVITVKIMKEMEDAVHVFMRLVNIVELADLIHVKEYKNVRIEMATAAKLKFKTFKILYLHLMFLPACFLFINISNILEKKI